MSAFGGLLSPLITQAAQARGGYLQGQQQGQELALKNAIQAMQMKRQAEQDALAQKLGAANIAHLGAQSKALEEGVWGPAFPATINGVEGLYQQHKQTGGIRRATISDGSAPSTSSTVSASPSPSMAGVGDSQDMTGGTEPPQQATQSPKKVGAQPLSPYVKPAGPKNPVMGSPEWQAAERFKAGLRPNPQQSFTFQTMKDPATGQDVVLAGNTKTGQLTPTGYGAKSSAGGGGQSLSPDDRAKMMEQAKLDNATMKAYENKVLATGKPVGVAAGLSGAAAGTAGTGFLSQAGGILGNKATGAIDPDYQRYITAQRSYGRIMGNLQSKRYTDHQAEIERSISGLQGADLAGTIRYKQDLRDKSLAEPPSASQTGGGRAGGGAQPTREQQLWDAAVAKHGKAKVLQEVGPRPGGDE